MKSWKIGAISGLIAGLVSGIVYSISLVQLNLLGFPHPYWPLPPEFTSIMEMAITEIILAVIWGIILGVIYSRFYDIIPGKKVSKGLLFGLIIYSIYNIRFEMLGFHYGYTIIAFSGLLAGFFTWIVYGLAIGILYEFMGSRYHVPKDRKRVRTYPIMSGIFPGAFAGCIYGIVVSLDNVLMGFLEIWEWIPNYLADIEFLIYQFGTHVFFDLIWGAIFGMLFAFFYERVPGHNISKGLIFSMIIFSITNLPLAIHSIVYGIFAGFFAWAFAIFAFIAYGLVLGYLYKPKK